MNKLEFTPEQLRTLDEWAARFVGRKVALIDRQDEAFAWLRDSDSPAYDSRWYPSSPNAPLWQLQAILNKAYEKPRQLGKVMTKLSNYAGTYHSALHVLVNEPAAVIAAIRDVVEESNVR